MTSRLLISLSLLLAGQKLSAQLAPADSFFNGGAQLYISNNVPAALERVESGRKFYPDDEKLKKLEELLKQQQQQQQQQKQDQNQPPEQKKDSQPPKPDEQKQDQPDQKKAEEQKPQEPKKDPGGQPGDEKPEPQPAQPVKPGEMTPEEAGRLLDAQKGNEQLLQLMPPEKPRDNRRPVKDW